jgi:ketosteroid isomerase-like protein
MTDNTAPADLAVAFVEAFARKDMAAVAGFFAPDIVFESPQVRIEGAAAVAEAMGQFAQAIGAIDIIASFGDGERAVIMYDMKTGPFGTLRAADHLVIRDGKIVSDQLVFDTYEVRKFQTPSD